MKALLLIFLLAAFLPAAAQQSRIIDVAADSTITWTNAETNVFCGIEWNWNLGYTWLPAVNPDPGLQPLGDTGPVWNILVTQPVCQVTIEEFNALWFAVQNVTINMGDDPPHGIFLRLLSSREPLGDRLFTNLVRMVNASTSPLSSVEFGLQVNWSREQTVDAEDLPPGSNTVYHPLTMTWPYESAELAGPPGVYMAYTQADTFHDHATGLFIPFGPPEKRVSIIVSNDSYTVDLEWTRRNLTTPY